MTTEAPEQLEGQVVFPKEISISGGSLMALAGLLTALGGAFMAFYSNVCTPQIATINAEKTALVQKLEALTEAINRNTNATLKLESTQHERTVK